MRYLNFKVYTNKKNGQITMIPRKKQLTKAKINMPRDVKFPLKDMRKWLV